MKRIIAAGILLALSVFISLFSLNTTKQISEEISSSAEALESAIGSKSGEAQEMVGKLVEDWERDYKVLSTYISHQHLEEVENHIALLEKYAQVGNFDAASIICSEISKSIKHIYTSEKPKIQNIF